MGRDKLKRFKELKTFHNTFEFPIDLKGKWNTDVFKNNNDIILEIGCGRGEYTVGLSSLHPENNFIGIDLKGARIWKGAKTCFTENRHNAAFIRSRIVLLEQYFIPSEISGIWLTFPDPQPKDRWESRRLTSDAYLNVYKKFLKPGGIIHLKTDSSFLYEYTLDLARKKGMEILFYSDDIYSEPGQKPEWNIQTTYEKIFKLKGETIKLLEFKLD